MKGDRKRTLRDFLFPFPNDYHSVQTTDGHSGHLQRRSVRNGGSIQNHNDGIFSGLRRLRGNPDMVSTASSMRHLPVTPPYETVPNSPQIAYNCLLIPVGLAFWWYWTKKAARNALREVLPPSETASNPAEEDYQCYQPEMGYDGEGNFVTSTPQIEQFHSWDDVVQQESKDQSIRFVRWIKGKRAKRRQRLSSKRAKRNVGSSSELEASRIAPMLSYDDDSVSTGTSDSPFSGHQRILHWQCIEDMTGFELCELQQPGSSESDMQLNTDDILEHFRKERAIAIHQTGSMC